MDQESLKKRPGILVVGSPSVGKRTLISRLITMDIEDASDSSSDFLVYGWTIDTKYYKADISVWIMHLQDDLYTVNLPTMDRIAALLMVFDVTDPLSFVALKEWVSRNSIHKFDILLCVGNKVDLLPGHPAHIDYKRRLMKYEDSSVSSHQEFSDYGISETDGSSLLGNEELPWGIKNSYVEWCLEHNIEYIEACASSADFDKCLSVDGDSQGVERVHGAVSAHMWPGMQLKSGETINEPSLPEQVSSEEESDYELEYDILSSGSAAEAWDYVDGVFTSADGPVSTSVLNEIPTEQDSDSLDREIGTSVVSDACQPSTSTSQLPEELDAEEAPACEIDGTSEEPGEEEGRTYYDIEGLEMLMGEIGNMRSNLRLMPDFQRREMAAKLAMKMAEMFGGEDEFDS